MRNRPNDMHGTERGAYSILVEKSEGNLSLKDLGVDGNIILKWILKNRVEFVNHIDVYQDRY
jgi:hypothetical protein